MTEKILLPSGLRIVLETMPHLRSVSTGLWVSAGSAYEKEQESGMSHFLEHLLFKGTEKRNALQISATMEGVGGVLNAFTSREHTCYYTRSMDEHFGLSLELLADMYLHSLLDPKEVERERNVIMEEINMYEDSPEDVAADIFLAQLWPGHPYGRPISGTLSSVEGVSRDQLVEYLRSVYVPRRTVLAVAGNVTAEQVRELAERLFPAEEGQALPTLPSPISQGGAISKVKDIEQSHICMGFPGLSLDDPDYYAANVLANILGGGASSRLFQEVREKRALSYSSYCYLDSFDKSGFLMAYSATHPKHTRELIQVMAAQFSDIAAHGVSDEELQRSRDQLRGTLLLSMESSSSVMSRLGRTELALCELFNLEDRVRKLASVSHEDLARVAKRLLRPGSMVLSQVSPKPIEIDTAELF
ncbi:MAG: pitrilysin family protein [Bacillota bacterium]|nr:pitrilysin family protein [Bacillota bacterium]